jgi:Pentapeptide repeats (8 copies)
MKIVQIGVLVVVIALIVLFILGYIFNWTWTGVGPYVSPPHPQGSDFQREKTLYDWFQLAIIPVALAVGVWWLNRVQQQRDQQLADERAKTEREIATDNQREAALQAYIDKVSELLLHERLGEPVPPQEVVTIAQARTATVLRILDPIRRASIIQFLSQSGILSICVEKSAKGSFDLQLNNENSLKGIELQGTNLNGVNLSMLYLGEANLQRTSLKQANLQRTDLSSTNLQDADLSHANLHGARLFGADLQGARLFMADLQGAKLSGASLDGANLKDATGITIEELEKQAKSLKGTIMPDGTKHA